MSWTQDFYNTENYLKTHIPLLTDDVNSDDTDGIEELLKLKAGAKILDMPTGFGRHAILLAKRGYRVTGLDKSADFIKLAQENSVGEKKVKFMVQDMQTIDYENQFDAVINVFTSFGYFSEAENFDFVRRVSRALKKGGKFLVDTLNREWTMLQTLKNGMVWLLYPDNTVFLANNKFNIKNGRWHSDQLIVEKGVSKKQYQDIRLYTYTEMKLIFDQYGLTITEVYGDLKKEPYTKESRNMVILAEKTR